MQPRLVEVSLHKILKPKGATSYLLAVSGGADSMAMLYAFHRLQSKIGFELAVAHVHHGQQATTSARDEAWSLVQSECERLHIPCYSNKKSREDMVSPSGESEAQLREFRRSELKKILVQAKCQYVVMAQHADDLLETRLIRLIRGVGSEGLVAMQVEKNALLRPFLQLYREDLRQYLQQVKGAWYEDPSNQQNKYLRNWIRNSWLPLLEKKHSGAVRSFTRSLESIAQSLTTQSFDTNCIENQRLIRPLFLQLALSDKRRVAAMYFGQCGITNYGLSHINELIKRLDVEQNELTFRLLKKNWRANARHIWFDE